MAIYRERRTSSGVYLRTMTLRSSLRLLTWIASLALVASATGLVVNLRDDGGSDVLWSSTERDAEAPDPFRFVAAPRAGALLRSPTSDVQLSLDRAVLLSARELRAADGELGVWVDDEEWTIPIVALTFDQAAVAPHLAALNTALAAWGTETDFSGVAMVPWPDGGPAGVALTVYLREGRREVFEYTTAGETPIAHRWSIAPSMRSVWAGAVWTLATLVASGAVFSLLALRLVLRWRSSARPAPTTG